MRRHERQIDEPKLIEQILNESSICRIAFSIDGEAHIVPVSFGYKENKLYIHSAPEGQKIDGYTNTHGSKGLGNQAHAVSGRTRFARFWILAILHKSQSLPPRRPRGVLLKVLFSFCLSLAARNLLLR